MTPRRISLFPYCATPAIALLLLQFVPFSECQEPTPPPASSGARTMPRSGGSLDATPAPTEAFQTGLKDSDATVPGRRNEFCTCSRYANRRAAKVPRICMAGANGTAFVQRYRSAASSGKGSRHGQRLLKRPDRHGRSLLPASENGRSPADPDSACQIADGRCENIPGAGENLSRGRLITNRRSH